MNSISGSEEEGNILAGEGQDDLNEELNIDERCGFANQSNLKNKNPLKVFEDMIEGLVDSELAKEIKEREKLHGSGS
ncbi:hypothetical protein Acr_07g0013160 [Actinidia rufa]|uniref:Uncharacterized protein n=1 Tax=Actinidia rufa TaxID=165716 RepID=A0A7J0EXI5_9ERIC|nr:hypothetical protein Acr_07g0013160 [Actinidia rufa]